MVKGNGGAKFWPIVLGSTFKRSACALFLLLGIVSILQSFSNLSYGLVGVDVRRASGSMKAGYEDEISRYTYEGEVAKTLGIKRHAEGLVGLPGGSLWDREVNSKVEMVNSRSAMMPEDYFKAVMKVAHDEWEAKRLWYYKSMVAQSKKSQFQCYTAKKQAFKVCTSPKVSSSMWKMIFCNLNENPAEECVKGTRFWFDKRYKRTNSTIDESRGTSIRVVRDPLERLVSAYFDKCVRNDKRTREGHCHPKLLMIDDKKQKDYFLNPEVFHQWIDLLGYDWDEHVMPQCVEKFHMDKKPVFPPPENAHIVKLDEHYFSSVNQIVESHQGFNETERTYIIKLFNKMAALSRKRDDNLETYKKFYSKASISKALMYYTMDYECFNLPLPDWINDITD